MQIAESAEACTIETSLFIAVSQLLHEENRRRRIREVKIAWHERMVASVAGSMAARKAMTPQPAIQGEKLREGKFLGEKTASLTKTSARQSKALAVRHVSCVSFPPGGPPRRGGVFLLTIFSAPL